MMILCCYTEENVYSALNFRHIKRTILWFQVPVWKSDKLQAYRIENREDGCKIAPSNNCPNFITPLRTLHLIVIVILTKSPPPSSISKLFSSLSSCVCVSYPAGLVTDEADEQGGQFGAPHLWRGGIWDHHEALGTGFPDAPKAVWAQVEELGHLCQNKVTSVQPETLNHEETTDVQTLHNVILITQQFNTT